MFDPDSLEVARRLFKTEAETLAKQIPHVLAIDKTRLRHCWWVAKIHPPRPLGFTPTGRGFSCDIGWMGYL